MATYIVCNGGQSETRSVANAGFQYSDTVRQYVDGGCYVTERTNTLQFNSFVSCDTDFVIYYKNTIVTYINGNHQTPDITEYGSVTMEAGHTTAQVEVRLALRYDCNNGQPPSGIYQQNEV